MAKNPDLPSERGPTPVEGLSGNRAFSSPAIRFGKKSGRRVGVAHPDQSDGGRGVIPITVRDGRFGRLLRAGIVGRIQSLLEKSERYRRRIGRGVRHKRRGGVE